jgi:hypothetical protein
MAREPIIIRDTRTRERVAALVATLDLGRPWEVTVKPYTRKRSLSANALYFAWINEVVKIIHNDTGQDKEDVHEYLKRKFLEPRRFEVNGEEFTVYSTKNLSSADFKSFMDKVMAWAATDLGIMLPTPEELP